ncbi:MAG: YdeI/OmpD-associated family protein [Methanobacteriaceae archaeon]|nr:YdeI/OmpD-associated family protein [Methanobacteriaceae archaeon]
MEHSDDVEDLILPEDLKKVFEQNKKAEQHFQNFNVSSKKQILWWIASAKGPETRKRRIKKVVELAAQNKTP